jgi:hypothetical protein
MFKSEGPNKLRRMSMSVDMRDPEGRRTMKSIFIPTFNFFLLQLKTVFYTGVGPSVMMEYGL